MASLAIMFAEKGILIQKDSHVVIATAASNERMVLDAKADANCSLCNELVWVSPSTKAYGDLSKMFFACDNCIKPLWHQLKKVNFNLEKQDE